MTRMRKVPARFRGPSIPRRFEASLTTPHSHEGEHNRPLWLIWKRPADTFPTLDSVCDSEESARYHLSAVLESKDIEVYVERIPANHRFGNSEFSEMQMKGYHAVRVFRKCYQLDGD